MKKLLIVIGTILLILALNLQSHAIEKPIYVNIKIGFFAKWSVTIGDCKTGWGICISLNPVQGQNYIGYDEETDKFYIKVGRTDPASKDFNRGAFELKEDSPIDPKVLTSFANSKWQGKVVTLKKGIYQVSENDGYYEVNINYYLQ
jgi:hypothetical protein